MTPLTPEQVAKTLREVRRLWTDGHIDTPECNKLERLGASHEAMRREWASARVGDEIARRHADGWHPEFASDPKDHRWVPRLDDEDPEPLTVEQYEWYEARRAERHARKAER